MLDPAQKHLFKETLGESPINTLGPGHMRVYIINYKQRIDRIYK